MLILLPLFIYSQWFLSYQSTFTAVYHSVRGRALIGFLSPIFGLIGALLTGSFLDTSSIFGRRRRFQILFYAIYAIYTIFWIGMTVVQRYYSKSHPLGLDWTDGEYYASFVFLLLWA